MTLSFGPGALRVVLAVLVVISHLTELEIGRPAVFVFFMLSGYWVSAVYRTTYRGVILSFYLARFLRVWLPFAAAFLLALACYAAAGIPKPPATWTGLALFGIASTRADALSISWSLDIELQFYLLVPLIVALLPWRKSMVAATMALTLAGWFLLMRYDIWTVFAYLPPFIAGAYLPRFSGRAALSGLIAFALIGAFVAAVPYLRPLLQKDVMGPFHPDWFGLPWVLALIPFVGWNVRQQSGWLDRHAGNFAYALYITHWPVVVLSRHWASDAWLALSIPFVALTFYILVDRTCERLRQRIIGGRYRAP